MSVLSARVPFGTEFPLSLLLGEVESLEDTMESGKIQRLLSRAGVVVTLTLGVLLSGCDQIGLGDEDDDDDEGVPVTLAWDPPFQNTNGTEIIELAGFRIYHGTSPGVYTKMIEVPDVTEFTVDSLSPGVTYYLSVTAYDHEFNESDFSEELAIVVGSGSVVEL